MASSASWRLLLCTLQSASYESSRPLLRSQLLISTCRLNLCVAHLVHDLLSRKGLQTLGALG